MLNVCVCVSGGLSVSLLFRYLAKPSEDWLAGTCANQISQYAIPRNLSMKLNQLIKEESTTIADLPHADFTERVCGNLLWLAGWTMLEHLIRESGYIHETRMCSFHFLTVSYLLNICQHQQVTAQQPCCYCHDDIMKLILKDKTAQIRQLAATPICVTMHL